MKREAEWKKEGSPHGLRKKKRGAEETHAVGKKGAREGGREERGRGEGHRGSRGDGPWSKARYAVAAPVMALKIP